MWAKILIENGQEKEFLIPDKDVELLEKSAAIKMQMMASEGGDAASEIAFGIIPWGIDRIRQELKGIHVGDRPVPEEEQEDEIYGNDSNIPTG